MNTLQYAIECRNVGKQYPYFRLNDIDLVVPTGSVMGFVGPNGAGPDASHFEIVSYSSESTSKSRPPPCAT